MPIFVKGKFGWNKIADTGKCGLRVTSKNNNVLTYIPQDIKLELNNSTLILAQGCKGYMGDGTVRTTTGTLTLKNAGAAQMFLHITSGGSGLYAGYMTGGTVSERPSSPIIHASYYNTSTQKCEYYNGSSWVEVSLPIAIVTRGADGFTSIDQIFNGFGYIGGSRFSLPGVKGLMSNGFNADGTYKVTEYKTSKVTVVSNNIYGNTEVAIGLLTNGKCCLYLLNVVDKFPDTPKTNNLYYVSPENKFYWVNSNINTKIKVNILIIGKETNTSDRITSFTVNPVQPDIITLPVTEVYAGSTKVYDWLPYPINTQLTEQAPGDYSTELLPGVYRVVVCGGGGSFAQWVAGRFGFANGGGSGAFVELEFYNPTKQAITLHAAAAKTNGSSYMDLGGERMITCTNGINAVAGSSGNAGGTYTINSALDVVNTIKASNGNHGDNNGLYSIGPTASVSTYNEWGRGAGSSVGAVTGAVRLTFVRKNR